MEVFDIAILGCGVAGSLLLHEILKSNLSSAKILFIDPDAKEANDRVISFWSRGPFPFPELEYRSWENISLHSDQGKATKSINDYKYYSFESILLYDYIRQLLSEHPNVQREYKVVDSVIDHGEYVEISCNTAIFRAKRVFDGRRNLPHIRKQAKDHTHMLQEFTGYKIRTSASVFDTSTPTLFDFRLEQNDCFSFCYVIPYSTREAVIDCVTFTQNLNNNTEERLKRYIKETLGIETYEVTLKEAGVIPLTDYPFARRVSKHVYTIGTAGGRVKPSTGFGFTRILRDSQEIVKQLEAGTVSLKFPKTKLLYRVGDSLLLQAIIRDPAYAHTLFLNMFKRPTASHIFRFLDEEWSLTDTLTLGLDLPKWRMVREI
jgi:lycopene beta-cyclase